MPKSITFTHEEDVCRFEIAVHDAERVRGPERRRHGVDDADDGGERQRAGFGQALLQIDAVEVLHDEIRQAFPRLVEVEDLDDVGVLHRGHDLRLPAEPRERSLVVQQVRP
jgi:hypothetical protein